MERMQSKIIIVLGNSGGRRLGVDRRRFSYASYIPERRCGQNRRNHDDRRRSQDRRNAKYRAPVPDIAGGNRRSGTERRVLFIS